MGEVENGGVKMYKEKNQFPFSLEKIQREKDEFEAILSKEYLNEEEINILKYAIAITLFREHQQNNPNIENPYCGMVLSIAKMITKNSESLHYLTLFIRGSDLDPKNLSTKEGLLALRKRAENKISSPHVQEEAHILCPRNKGCK
jgi:hypothetical protein